MCEIWTYQKEMVERLHEKVATQHLHLYYHYALLVLVTNTPFDRAVAYLQDTGSPEAAEGRLLLRAAERSLRQTGDTPDGDKQEGDESHG